MLNKLVPWKGSMEYLIVLLPLLGSIVSGFFGKRLGAKTTDDLKVGAFATLATPFVFSTVWQGSEDRTLDPKRTTVETTIGATAGALFSVGFAGTAELARRATRLNRSTVNRAYEDILKSEGANVTDIGPDGYNVGSVKLLEKLRKEVNE